MVCRYIWDGIKIIIKVPGTGIHPFLYYLLCLVHLLLPTLNLWTGINSPQNVHVIIEG